MIAACDTFRSGAVEQLKTHCNRLQIPLYERGYEKDPAKVAYEAAQQAARSKIDVLLVDTAGANCLCQSSHHLLFLCPPEPYLGPLYFARQLNSSSIGDWLGNESLLEFLGFPKAVVEISQQITPGKMSDMVQSALCWSLLPLECLQAACKTMSPSCEL